MPSRGVIGACAAAGALVLSAGAVLATPAAREGAAIAAWSAVEDVLTPQDAAATPASTATPTPQPSPVAAGPVLPAAVRTPGPAGAPTLASAVDALLRNAALGPHVGAIVVDVGDGNGSGTAPAVLGDPLYERASQAGYVPASTTKILTAAAALSTLGPGHTFTTSVRVDGSGTYYLVGGADPMLSADPARIPGAAPGSPALPERTSLVTLADAVAAAVKATAATANATAGTTPGTTPGAPTAATVATTPRIQMRVDDSLFPGPAVPAAWEARYVQGSGASAGPVGALALDGGRARPDRGNRVADPGIAAGEAFAALLKARGVEVSGTVQRRAAPVQATEVANAESVPLEQIVEHMLTTSDNDVAELLGRHVSLARGGDGNEAASPVAIVAALADLGIPVEGTRLLDGSGLARGSRVVPATLAATLALAGRDIVAGGGTAAGGGGEWLRPLLTGLPVGGFTGTLVNRFGETDVRAGAGVVRAKTGSLLGVVTLAGYVSTLDGRALAFVLMADQVPGSTAAVRRQFDRAVAAMAGCGCQ